MPYSIHVAGPADHTAACVTVADREEALKIAQAWARDGNAVRIIGDGMIYPLEQFTEAIAVGNSKTGDNILPRPPRDRGSQ
jgi:hypothetical protein